MFYKEVLPVLPDNNFGFDIKTIELIQGLSRSSIKTPPQLRIKQPKPRNVPRFITARNLSPVVQTVVSSIDLPSIVQSEKEQNSWEFLGVLNLMQVSDEEGSIDPLELPKLEYDFEIPDSDYEGDSEEEIENDRELSSKNVSHRQKSPSPPEYSPHKPEIRVADSSSSNRIDKSPKEEFLYGIEPASSDLDSDDSLILKSPKISARIISIEEALKIAKSRIRI